MKGFFTLLLLASLGLNVFFIGCRLINPPVPQAPPPNLSAEIQRLRDIAVLFGVEAGRLHSMSMLELLTDIQIKLNDYERYAGKVLTEQEIAVLQDMLSSRSTTKQCIKDYDAFIKKLEGKKIVILPSKE